MTNLTCYLDLVFKSIITSVMMCPQLMRDAFAILKELSLKYFREREICYSVISGFIFLRFFAPAILNPKLFDITDQTIDPVVCRTLTLMSKTMQVLGNLVSSKFPSHGGDSATIFKEDYMATLQKRFITGNHIDNTRVFLELISSPNSVPRISERPMTLKEGILLKRVVGKAKKYGMSFNKFKRRHFCLTTQDLFYAKSKQKPVSWNLPVSDIRAVEKLREDSFKMKNVNHFLSYVSAADPFCFSRRCFRSFRTKRLCTSRLAIVLKRKSGSTSWIGYAFRIKTDCKIIIHQPSSGISGCGE